MNLQLALYASHLGSGGALLCKSVKVGTIQKYLLAIATFLQRHDPQQRDFRRIHNSDKQLALPISAILKELEWWETIPNRRKLFTLEMLTVLRAT
jgi:hypothetical protein